MMSACSRILAHTGLKRQEASSVLKNGEKLPPFHYGSEQSCAARRSWLPAPVGPPTTPRPSNAALRTNETGIVTFLRNWYDQERR
jgi:hypothetical protein